MDKKTIKAYTNGFLICSIFYLSALDYTLSSNYFLMNKDRFIDSKLEKPPFKEPNNSYRKYPRLDDDLFLDDFIKEKKKEDFENMIKETIQDLQRYIHTQNNSA